MKVIEVIPIVRGITRDALTYFTSADPAVGSIVSAEVRGRKISGIVVSAQDATEAKSELRQSSFAIKKAEEISSGAFFAPEFLAAVKDTARYYAGTVGGALHGLVPRIVLENIADLKSSAIAAHSSTGGGRGTRKTSHHILIYQADDRERAAQFKSIVREEFARGSSVFICVPSAADATRIKDELDRGIGEYTYVFHSQLKKRAFLDQWNKLAVDPHPVLIIATGSFLCVPRHDVSTLIIERENSRTYKLQTRPYVDVRTCAELYAKHIGARLILADVLLRTETIFRFKQDEVTELSSLNFRSTTTAAQRIIDSRREKTARGTPSPIFETISRELEYAIRAAHENNEQTFLFASRRGLAPLTLCSDCGAIVLCHNCHVPVVLHTTSTERFFLCHHCGERQSAEEKCQTCGGWRLRTLGVGIELVAEELARKFPHTDIFRIDSDSVKTNARAQAVMKKFRDKPGSILLGTEMAISYLDAPVENTAVVSTDSLFGVPDFRIGEKILSTLLKIRSLATKQFIIQTRNPEHRLFGYALAGNLLDFYKEELEERQRFDYPPFAVLIKISLTGPLPTVEQQMESIREHFKDYAFDVYRAMVPRGRGGTSAGKKLVTEHMLVKIGKKRWVDEHLLELIKLLPPQFSVEVEPESIL